MGRWWTARRRLLTTGGATLAAAFAGCLEERPGEDDPQLGEPEPFVEVKLSGAADGDCIDPPVVHLVDGGAVEWTVESGTHDATASHPETHGEHRRIPEEAEPWASGTLSEGDSFDRTFDGEGVYDYACTSHEAHAAVGSVVVGWPEPDGEPGLEPPADGYPDAAADALERHNDRIRDVLEEAHG